MTVQEMPSSYDPYGDNKIYHFAALWNKQGGVSALCYERPRSIKLWKHLWTICEDAVTCKKCRKLLAERAEAKRSSTSDGSTPPTSEANAPTTS